MRNRSRLVREINDADFLLRKVTGKGVADLAKLAWNTWGNRAMQYLRQIPQVKQDDVDDLKDCRLFGADNFFHYNVFRLAVRIFREEHHPDRFISSEQKQQHQEIFKQGEAASARICQRRGWKIP